MTDPTPQHPRDPHDPRPQRTDRRPIGRNWNRITIFEVIGYTSAILFIAALALGWFDIVLPWDTP